MRKALTIIMCLIYAMPVFAQDEYAKAIPGLLKQLNKTKADTARVGLLLKLGHYYVFKQGEQVSDLDTAVILARQAADLSTRLQYMRGAGLSYLTISQAWREKKDTAASRPYADKAIALLMRFGTKTQQADAWKERAMYHDHFRAEERVQKIYYQERAVELYKEAGDSLNYAKELVLLSEITDSDDDLSMSLEALRVFKHIGYKDLQGIYYLIGSQYSMRHNHTGAVRYCEMAVKIAEERDTTMQLCTVYNRLALAYFEIGETVKARDFFYKAMRVAEKYRDIDAIWMLAPNIATTTIDKRRRIEYLQMMLKRYPVPEDDDETKLRINSYLLDATTDLGWLPSAEKYMKESLPIFNRLVTYSWYKGPFYRAAIKYYTETNQYKAAGKFLHLYEDFNARHRRDEPSSFIHFFRAKVDSAEGRFASSLQHFKEYKRLQDTIMLQTKTREFARAQVEFETIRKEKDLKLRERDIQLLTRKGELQQSALRQAQLIRNLIIIGSLALILLLALGYNRYRLKQHTNRELESKQIRINQQNASLKKLIREKEWLVREIHHRVKNNLQIVMSLLNTQAAHMEEGSALSAIKDSRLRMQAIALLHQKLYQVENAGLIEMSAYIQELVGNLRLGYESMQHVRFHVDIAHVMLDVSQATPIGLLLNEAITNSMKYAFDGRGNVRVSLQQQPGRVFVVTVSDDGKGLPADFNRRSGRSSFGMNLIETLAQQLEGQLEIINDKGVTIRVTFREQWEEQLMIYDKEDTSLSEEYV